VGRTLFCGERGVAQAVALPASAPVLCRDAL
jgi:hypothetical protein